MFYWLNITYVNNLFKHGFLLKIMRKNEAYFLVFRYLILLLLGVSLWIFYFIFTPLTVYPVYYLLKLFFNATLSGNMITFKGLEIQLIKACVAGSAYYLLLILNLSTPMNSKTRLSSITFLFSSFLVINILRIFVFSLFLINFLNLFSTLHLIFWYFLSTIIVVGLWLLNLKIFKIKSIPVYTDIKFLSKKT